MEDSFVCLFAYNEWRWKASDKGCDKPIGNGCDKASDYEGEMMLRTTWPVLRTNS